MKNIFMMKNCSGVTISYNVFVDISSFLSHIRYARGINQIQSQNTALHAVMDFSFILRFSNSQISIDSA